MMRYPSEEPKTAEEKKWRAESDARTLAEAEVIKGDEDRLKAASEAAEDMAKQAQEEAHGLATVAKSLNYKGM